MSFQRLLRHFLLPLSLLLALSFSSQPCDAADGQFRGWQISDVAVHPDSDLVYLLDRPRFIRVVNRTSGRTLQRDVAELRLDDWDQVLAIGSDAPNNRVYALVALIPSDWRDESVLYVLRAYSSDLAYLKSYELNDSLDPPPNRYSEQLISRTLHVDRDGRIYLARQLSNGTLLVSSIDFDRSSVSTWAASFATSEERTYSLALGPNDALYFLSTYQSFWGYAYEEPHTLYVTDSYGKVMAATNISASRASCFRSNAMAVSRSSGNLAISCDRSIQLFNPLGEQVPGFQYTSTIGFYYSFQSLAFTSGDRLLAVGNGYFEAAVQVISTVNGDLLTKWTDGVPALYSVMSIEYQPYSRSLVAFRQDYDSAVIRLDADTGGMLQEYALIGRLSRCYPGAGATGFSGDVYLALECYEFTVDRGYVTKVVLHAMTPAGRVRREAVLQGIEGGDLQDGPLVVAEDKQLVYVLTSAWSRRGRNAVIRALAFHFNGSLAFNFSDSRIGSLGSYASTMQRIDDNTLAVVDSDNGRIALLDMNSGAFFGNITVPTDTYLMAAAYDGKQWYRSEAVVYNNSGVSQINSSINVYDAEGRWQGQYFWGEQRRVAALSIAGDEKGQRLYVQDQYDGSVAYWNINAQPSEKRAPVAVEQREPVERQANSAAFEAAVRALRQKGMAEQKQRVEKLQAAAKRRAQAPAPARAETTRRR